MPVTTLLQGCHCNLLVDSLLTVEFEDAPCKKACNEKDPVTTLLQGRHCNLLIDSLLTVEFEDASCKKACNKKDAVTTLLQGRHWQPFYWKLSYSSARGRPL